MRSFLTRVSSFQVDTITTWMQSTQNTVTAVAGHLRYACSGSSWAMYANCPGSDMTWNRTRTPNSNTRKTLRRATARCSSTMHRLSLLLYRMSIDTSLEPLDDQTRPGASRRPRLHGALRGWVVQ